MSPSNDYGCGIVYITEFYISENRTRVEGMLLRFSAWGYDYPEPGEKTGKHRMSNILQRIPSDWFATLGSRSVGCKNIRVSPVIAPKNGNFFEFALDRMRF
jgi:hypothetical protein